MKIKSASLIGHCLLVTALGLAFMASGSVMAQELPQTNIWLASLEQDLPGEPIRVNPASGYNNQPHFSADGLSLYYTREMPHSLEGMQTDIAAYDIRSRQTRMLNSNDESEYSPTPIPGRNALSVIEVEPDGRQKLWSLDIDSGEMQRLLPNVEPVGYHAWIDDDSVAMFILGETFTLQTARIGNGSATVVADNIGRTIRKHPQTGEILYVDQNTEPWQITAINTDTGAKRSVMPLFPNDEDFTIDSKGRFWTGNGSKLYQRSEGDSHWQLVADFSSYGINNISRLATDPSSSRIALVGQ